MRLYFADAWFFIALLDPFDSHHGRARRLRAVVRDDVVVTHDAVLTEVLAYFSGDGPHARREVAKLVRKLLSSVSVVECRRELFLRALTLYEERDDKKYSLVDCMSMEVIRERGITHVLTNDHHFRQEGFTVLSDAP